MSEDWNIIAQPKFPCPKCNELLSPRLPLFLRCYNKDCDADWFPLEEINKEEYDRIKSELER